MDTSQKFGPKPRGELENHADIDAQFDALGEAVPIDTGHDLALDFDIPEKAAQPAAGFGIIRGRSGAFSGAFVSATPDSRPVARSPASLRTLDRAPTPPSFPESTPQPSVAVAATPTGAPVVQLDDETDGLSAGPVLDEADLDFGIEPAPRPDADRPGSRRLSSPPPPAGPEPTANTGTSLAVSTRIMPPDEATTSSGAVMPAAPRLRVRFARYRRISTSR